MAAKTTPVMKQHAAAKAAHPDCVVFFRLGDFYEMFGDDAVLVAGALDLTLTSRNKGKPDEVPMAGVPHHAAQGYIARLLQQGHKVAICEQMADPKEVKGIVPRQVVRVITPGTWIDEAQLDTSSNNWLAALHWSNEQGKLSFGLALVDLGTAELMAAPVPDANCALSELSRAAPREILIPEEGADPAFLTDLQQIAPATTVRVCPQLTDEQVAATLSGLEMQGLDDITGQACARALDYARQCFLDRGLFVWRIAHLNPTGLLGLDRAAQRHLELVESTVDDPKTTLFAVLNRTGSPGGARLLRRRLLAPLTSAPHIRRRQDQVEVFVLHQKTRKSVKGWLQQVGDLERLAVRGAQQTTHPRDLGNVRKGLFAARSIYQELGAVPDAESRSALGLDADFDLVPELLELLERALVERPPAAVKDGAVFLEGFDDELDRLAQLRASVGERISELERQLKERTGISHLRVKFTRVFGYYVEVSRSQAQAVPADWRRKQTVANGERFTLPELDDLAEEIESSDGLYRARELSLLRELVESLARASERVHRLAAFLSGIDVAAALAEVATEHDYCRPQVDDSSICSIKDGRHPVVERLAAAGRFVPNDTELAVDGERLWLITGPNMAGKSTFLRQVALTFVLAQMGSYVPAKQARLGIVDRVLSRVGASDNLAGGQSTFMVEMQETASILRSATSRSLVILDEVGRGTSTFDGMSIAWAVAEHLDQGVKCRALFATHYHELTKLAERSRSCANYAVSARYHEGEVVFLHRVTRGAASQSYGIAVAKLAGLPELVLRRAQELLLAFEAEGPIPVAQLGPATADRQLPLFASAQKSESEQRVIDALRKIDTDRTTGLQALTLLHELRRQLAGKGD